MYQMNMYMYFFYMDSYVSQVYVLHIKQNTRNC